MITGFVVVWLLATAPSASAHVPYIERSDYSGEDPFYIRKLIEKSKAFYAWLGDNGNDIDVYMFRVKNRPVRLYAELIVPVAEGYYDDFVPSFALVGPGLPELQKELPFSLPEGAGGIIKESVEPGTQRASFFEPFGGKSYFEGPVLDKTVTQPGTYYIYCWDPYKKGGDYVLVIGKGEFFGPADIIRSLINTPVIRMNGELHIEPAGD